MSRARNIKPGFFRNEELAELPFEVRILFQGLWCLADREGRLEDRPKRIKADVFPYDDVDVANGLTQLAVAGFIVRYEVEKTQYIQVLAFAKHQNPHCKEAASTIPAQCKPGAGLEITGTSRADSLIPDSLIPDSGTDAPRAVPPTPAKPKKAKAAEHPIAEWIDSLAGADAVPADDPLFDWAGKQGIPAHWLGYAWAAFEDRYHGKEKAYADWRAAFRDHVKRGWLDIWRADARNGGFVLTTVGEQWRNEVAA